MLAHQFDERDPLRHHKPHAHLAHPFGANRFGQLAERFARLFGTPRFLIAQTVIVAAWIAVNTLWLTVGLRWDKFPFILLNLVFSTQAAYAAPLILLAQTRQADRDKARAEADANHREEIAAQHTRLLTVNTKLTEDIHQAIAATDGDTR